MAPALGRAFTARGQARKIISIGRCIRKAEILNKKTRLEIVHRCGTELIVPIVDGLYCEEWLWLPEMLPEALETWWRALENVETFWNARSLSSWPGTLVHVDEDIQFYEIWEAAWNDGPYRARVEFNEQPDASCPDSFLRKADGTVFLHKGAFPSQVSEPTGSDDI